MKSNEIPDENELQLESQLESDRIEEPRVHLRVFTRVILFFAAATVLCAGSVSAQSQSGSTSAPAVGILLMAHGGGKDWNEKVSSVAAAANKEIPTEVAFGMADRKTLQAGIDQLTARGVQQIVAVPLFISSHSSVIESTKYLLGLRADAPKELADFAMDDMGGMSGMNSAPGHPAPAPAAKPAMPLPVKLTVPLRMAPALDHHPIAAEILSDRAATIAKDPSHDVLILVAHGPNDDSENAQWLADMAALAKQIAAHTSFARIEYVTLRDDADGPVRDHATAELRAHAQAADDSGYHVIVVPLLLSYGGIENGLRQRLDGVEHVLASQGLLPDPRIAQWVLQSARDTQAPQ